LKSDFSELTKNLDPGKLPCHVGMIMDGNGRWAKKKLMNRVRGHEQGSKTVRDIVTTSRKIGIQYLTLYAFSTENWARPEREVSALMGLLKKFVVSERQELNDQDICLNILGQISRLPKDVQKEACKTLEMTKNNKSMVLNLALNYGSREEITTCVRTLALKVSQGELRPEDITSESISNHLYTRGMPDPDLIIRTSGEFRLSNFLMWQAAYSELYITSTLWPDFTGKEFISILQEYQKRDRRFGKV
jgi:undecaprenyl diphosphate synthase